MQPVTVWRNRIVRSADVPPDQLLANPKNWRVHPKYQQDALLGVLTEVGVVQELIAVEGTDTIIDGHLRVSLALRTNQPTVRVKYVDLDEAEADLILAALDPLAALASTDRDKLDELLRDVSTSEEAVQAMLADLATREGIVPPDVEFKEYDESVADEVQYCECPSCGHRFPK